jgi:glycosyltransferase involved in cell wall biosynthesis
MTSRPPRVVFWDNLPSPYGVEQYNLLAGRGHLDLTVWFGARTEPGRSWAVDESSWRFPAAYIEDPGRSVVDAVGFAARCRAARPDLVISPYGKSAFVAGHAILKALGIPHILHAVPTFDSWTPRARWKELAKRILFRSASALYVPGPDGAAYARRYGVPDDRIYQVRLTANVEQYSRRLTPGARDGLRERLGVNGCVFLYVGRFWKPKGLLHLVDAYRQVRLAANDVSLLLIGDGADEPEIRQAAASVEGIIFWPFVQAASLHAYYAAADVFVFPTLGDPHGLVIEEAHAARLPVITSDAVGDVLCRVEDGVSGFVVPAGNTQALTDRMLTLAADPHRREAMGRRGADRMACWDHDVFAAGIEAMIDACLTGGSGKSRRSCSAAAVLPRGG